MKIDFANLQLQYQKYKTEIDASIHEVLNKSNYIISRWLSSNYKIKDLDEKFWDQRSIVSLVFLGCLVY